jgi:hypothetical protein
MRFRKLRIAWSVGCAIACALLIALWVRSHWWSEGASLWMPNKGEVGAGSLKHRIVVNCVSESLFSKRWRARPGGWSIHSNTIQDDFGDMTDSEIRLRAGLPDGSFSFQNLNGNGFRAVFPHWVPIVVFASFGVIPWFPWRFSLRTLLIAKTLIAVVLGLAVWLHKE